MSNFRDVTGQEFVVKGVRLIARSFKKVNGKVNWIFSCNTCEEKDPELWYLGSLTSALNNVEKLTAL